MLSERVSKISPSATVALSEKVNELKKDGVEIIPLHIGQPDFKTPANIIQAAKRAMDEGYTNYPPVKGYQDLREAICAKLERENNIAYQVDEIIVSTGAKQAVINTLLALCSPGDEVIIPTPCWVSYIDMVNLANGVPVLMETNEAADFQIDIEKLEQYITTKTKAIILNTPNNPTGAVYSEAILRKIGELAVKHDFYILSDEIYEKMIYDDEEHVSIASLAEEYRERTITINGVSKAFAMTGWRLGYAAGPEPIIKGMSTLQSHITSGANSISQKAALEAIIGEQEAVQSMTKEFAQRRKYLIDKINELEGISSFVPKGAFYVFPNVSQLFGKTFNGRVIQSSTDLALFLLEQAHVSVVPGEAFGSPNHIRIAYSTSLDNIKIGLKRIRESLLLLN